MLEASMLPIAVSREGCFRRNKDKDVKDKNIGLANAQDRRLAYPRLSRPADKS